MHKHIYTCASSEWWCVVNVGWVDAGWNCEFVCGVVCVWWCVVNGGEWR